MMKFDYSLIEVSDDSTAKKFLQGLNPKTTLDELRVESAWIPAKESRKEELIKEIEIIKTIDPQKNLRENEEKIKRFEIVKNKILQL